MVLARSLSNATSTPLTRALAAYRKLDLTTARRQRASSRTVKQARRLSQEQLARLAERYLEGATVYELADQFNVNRRTVANHLKREGVSLRRQTPSDELINQMVRLYASGLSLAKVGDQVGVDARTVHRCLQDRGVELRDTHGRARS